MTVCFPNTGNVVFVTFVSSHSSRRQPDQEPSTDTSATAAAGDVIHEPNAYGDGSNNFENQYDVPNGFRASHQIAVEKVSFGGDSRAVAFYQSLHEDTKLIFAQDDTYMMPKQMFPMTNESFSSSHSLNQILIGLD